MSGRPYTGEELDRITGTAMREYWRGLNKHGDWSELDYDQMFLIIAEEMMEAHTALKDADYYGDHGAFNELCQVSGCIIKMLIQVLRREQEL